MIGAGGAPKFPAGVNSASATYQYIDIQCYVIFLANFRTTRISQFYSGLLQILIRDTELQFQTNRLRVWILLFLKQQVLISKVKYYRMEVLHRAHSEVRSLLELWDYCWFHCLHYFNTISLFYFNIESDSIDHARFTIMNDFVWLRIGCPFPDRLVTWNPIND